MIAPTRSTESTIALLRELIAALDSRAPRPEHADETRIGQDAAALKAEALERIAGLQL